MLMAVKMRNFKALALDRVELGRKFAVNMLLFDPAGKVTRREPLVPAQKGSAPANNAFYPGTILRARHEPAGKGKMRSHFQGAHVFEHPGRFSETPAACHHAHAGHGARPVALYYALVDYIRDACVIGVDYQCFHWG